MLKKKLRLLNKVILSSCLSFAVVGCSTSDKRVEQKVASEIAATEPGELAARGFHAWSNSAKLATDQKTQLFNVHVATARDAYRIRDEISKTKTAMFKELARGDYDESLVEGFKTKIIKLDAERIDIMLRALASVQKILGRGDAAQRYYQYLQEIENRPFQQR